jgi:hypothetical protein
MINLINRRRHLRMGLLGEMAVAEELNRLMLDGCQVYHDFPAEKFNVDHIIVGPKGIFAVETKARSKKGKGKGEVEAIYDGQRLVFPNWTTTEFLDQAKNRARWLSSWLSKAVGEDIRAEPILTIPGWFIKRQRADGIPVLNPKEIRQYVISKDREGLSESMITRICHQIEQKCRTVDPMDIVPG